MEEISLREQRALGLLLEVQWRYWITKHNDVKYIKFAREDRTEVLNVFDDPGKSGKFVKNWGLSHQLYAQYANNGYSSMAETKTERHCGSIDQNSTLF